MKTFQTKDPYLLVSLLNTTLRDESSSLGDLCQTYNLNRKQIEEKMASIDYYYNQESNQFK